MNLGLFLVGDGRKVASDTERNGWAHDHDHEINFYLRGHGAAARPEDSGVCGTSYVTQNFVDDGWNLPANLDP
jgi:hypothetical protein